MQSLRVFLIVLCSALSIPAAWAQEAGEVDVEGSKDPTWLSRMPGYYVEAYDFRDYDTNDFDLVTEVKTVEGAKTKIGYRRKTGGKPISGLQVGRNYENALKKIGATILVAPKNTGTLVATVKRGAKSVWVGLWAEDEAGFYELVIVEPKTMEQEVTADAAALGEAINSTGRVAVYGILFDTGKSEVKPESEPALVEIAKLLTNDPKLNLHVVGHTDNQGAFDANMKLSRERA